jgi:hypothetical protein
VPIGLSHESQHTFNGTSPHAELAKFAFKSKCGCKGRNLGGSIGISVLVATLAQNTQVIHSRLVEGLRPDNPLAQAPYLAAPFSLSTPSGMAALNAEVTRQAAMVAYIDDFKLIMLIALTGSQYPAQVIGCENAVP